MAMTETCPLLENEEMYMKSSDKDEGILKRTVGPMGATGILFGNIVGAGIFISPKGVYASVGSAGAGLCVWMFAGITCGMASFTYTELGTMIQESGGEMVYIKRAFGQFLAFLVSFIFGFVVRPAVSAVSAMILSEYIYSAVMQHDVITYHDHMIVTCMAIFTCVILTVLCLVSVRLATAVCGIFAACKMIAIMFLVICGVCIAIKKEGHMENFTRAFEGSTSNPFSYGSAVLFSSLSYNSWNCLNTMTGEIIKPSRTLPIASITGMTLVTMFYILTNISYLMIFTVDEIIATNTIAMDSGAAAFGYVGKLGMCIGLVTSCGGCLLGGLFMNARILQSAAEKGLYPSFLTYISPTFNTPVTAQILGMMITIMYTLVDVNTLIPCLTSIEWLAYSLTFAALLKLRYSEPDTRRPIKVKIGFPIYLAVISLSFAVVPLGNKATRMPVIYGLFFIIIGTFFYALRQFINNCIMKNTKSNKIKI